MSKIFLGKTIDLMWLCESIYPVEFIPEEYYLQRENFLFQKLTLQQLEWDDYGYGAASGNIDRLEVALIATVQVSGYEAASPYLRQVKNTLTRLVAKRSGRITWSLCANRTGVGCAVWRCWSGWQAHEKRSSALDIER